MPAIVSNVTVPLLGLCDTAISGHLGSELFLAAIAVGSMMLNVIFWLFGFLRMGTTGLTASAFGASDETEIRKVFTRSLLIAFLLGFVLILFRRPLLALMLHIVGAPPSVEGLVAGYFNICIWEAPSLLATMALSGWFVGMQSTLWPMVIAISVNLLNITISCILVFVAGAGFTGVAVGTVTANWAGFIIALAAAMRFRKGHHLLSPVREIFTGGGISRFFSVNTSLFFRSFCIISVSLGVTAAGARLGALTLAVNAVIMQFFTLFSFFMDGFAFSAEALTGKAFGARQPDLLRRYVRALIIWAGAVAIIFTLFYMTGSQTVTSLLTDERSVRNSVREMSIWIWLIPVVSVWAFIYDGFYIGITSTGKMLVATLTASTIFFILTFSGLTSDSSAAGVASNRMLWTAFLTYLALRGIILAILWPGEIARRLHTPPGSTSP